FLLSDEPRHRLTRKAPREVPLEAGARLLCDRRQRCRMEIDILQAERMAKKNARVGICAIHTRLAEPRGADPAQRRDRHAARDRYRVRYCRDHALFSAASSAA